MQSPTYYNLHHYLQEIDWQPSDCNSGTDFNELNFEFHSQAAEALEFKHLLASLALQFCPEATPLTYHINESNWVEILNLIKVTHAQQPSIWILKPSLLNNGQHIKIFHHVDDLKKHYLGSNRLGGEHVLQQYLTQPHLLNGHKYSIRMFVILTNDIGTYLYPHGYLNVAKTAYKPADFADLCSHLTNEHLQHDASNVVQVPTKLVPGFTCIYQEIKTIVSKIIGGLQSLHPQAFIKQKQRQLAIFGFDFILDANLRVWLLEANHGPCFPCGSHPLQQPLYSDFWKAFIARFVVPIDAKSPISDIKYPGFESV